MNKKRIFLVVVILALVFSTISGQNSASPETIKIMSFNIQIFGVSKMAKPEVVDILAGIVPQADIIAVQEVRSMSLEPVEEFMGLLPDTYRYVIGPRQGRTSSKEQYWIIYNAEKITVLSL